MADNSGGANTVLAFIVGALLVVVIGAFVLGGIPGMKGGQSSAPSATLTVKGKG